jgi:hypothetical protein
MLKTGDERADNRMRLDFVWIFRDVGAFVGSGETQSEWAGTLYSRCEPQVNSHHDAGMMQFDCGTNRI